jgi:hypothetical protein
MLRNESETDHHWLRVRLEGTRSNRPGIGARVLVRAGGREQVREVTTSGSYLAAHDPRLLFGLGDVSGDVEITVRWPAGSVSRVRAPGVDREIVIREAGAPPRS